jgi:ribosomal protein S2
MVLRLTLGQLIESNMHLGNEAGSWDKGYSYYMGRVFENKVIVNLELSLLSMRKSSKFLSGIISSYGFAGFSDSTKIVLHWIKLFYKKWGQIVFWGYWFPGTLTNYRKFWSGRYLYRDKWRVKRNSMCINFFKFPSIFVLSSIKRSYDVLFECLKFKIPVIGLTDSNVRPYGMSFMIPGNDSSELSLGLFYLNVFGAVSTGFCTRRVSFLQKVLSYAVRTINSKRIKYLFKKTNFHLNKLDVLKRKKKSLLEPDSMKFSIFLYRRIMHYLSGSLIKLNRRKVGFYRRLKLRRRCKKKLLPYLILIARYGIDVFNLSQTFSIFFSRQKTNQELLLLRGKFPKKYKQRKRVRFKKFQKGVKIVSFRESFNKVYSRLSERLVKFKKSKAKKRFRSKGLIVRNFDFTKKRRYENVFLKATLSLMKKKKV